MKPRLSLYAVKYLANELDKKISSNFITNVFVINSSDIVFMFSFIKEKLLISLNHNAPFISLLDIDYNFTTNLGNLNENLRKYLKGAYITKVEQINNDRVIKMSLVKNNEFFEKENYSLILEFIPTINNLILLNSDNKILFAKHYTDLSISRPIIRLMEYNPLPSNLVIKEEEFDYKEYQNSINEYLKELHFKNRKEKALPLYNFFKNKIKSLKKKVQVLEKEKLDATNKLSYKEIGESLLLYSYDEEGLNNYITTLTNYDKELSPLENANKYFDKYKKSKRTIENDNREIEIALNTINEYETVLSLFDYYSDEETEELYKKYLPNKIANHKRHKEIDARLPYYIDYLGVRIGFGKNKEQNNYLTFKKANKEDIYLHVANDKGAHVVIFDKDPSKDIILLASEIALILSNKESGDIYIADIKDVKKGASLGEALIDKYETITLHKIREESKQLLTKQKRFN